MTDQRDEARTVANEILKQLGGAMFRRMTGAKDLTSHIEGRGALIFRLPNDKDFVKDGINMVKIILTAMDDYTLIFYRIWGSRLTEISQHKGVYCDNLRAVFTEATGLHTSLTRAS